MTVLVPLDEFLKAFLVPTGKILLRGLDKDGSRPSYIRWFDGNGLTTEIAPELEARTASHTFAPACRRGDATRGTKKELLASTVLWADADGMDPREVRRRAVLVGLPEPHGVIRTRHGSHAYWNLETPADLTDGDNVREFESHLRGLAVLLGADLRAATAEHTMRDPWKPDARERNEFAPEIDSWARDRVPIDSIPNDLEALVRIWLPHRRHALSLGLAALAYHKHLNEESAIDLVRNVARMAKDEEVVSRERDVRETFARARRGEPVAYKEFLQSAVPDALWIADGITDVFGKLSRTHSGARRSLSGGTTAHAQYVDAIMQAHRFATFEDTLEVYVYREGRYVPLGEARIREWVESRHKERGETAMHTFANEIVHAVRRRSYTPMDRFNPPGKLCLANGILDTETYLLAQHSPDVLFTAQLPVAYDPAATCPEFLAFLSWALPDAADRETIRHLFGYCLLTDDPYQIAFMFVGGGDNGKSTLHRALTGLLGGDNVASETLQRLSENRFAAANLWGKLANICSDIPPAIIRHTGTFKQLTGGDRIPAEFKGKGAFYFDNYAKLVFSCNELPEVNENTWAFWRRWILLEFRSVVAPDKKDPHLANRLLSELPGIMNWALGGLRDLREARGFPARPAGLMETWRNRADSLRWFVSETVEAAPKEYVAKADFYGSYVTFAEERGVRVKSNENVGKELPSLLPVARAMKRRIGGDKDAGKNLVPVWDGIKLRPPPPPPPPPPPLPPDEDGGGGEPGEKHPEQAEHPEQPDTTGVAVPGVPGVPGLSYQATRRDANMWERRVAPDFGRCGLCALDRGLPWIVKVDGRSSYACAPCHDQAVGGPT